MLHPHLLVDPTFVLRFRQEAGAAANLRHPNIVVIHEVGEIDGTYYIAMEYLPGTPLDELIKKEGPLALPRAAKIIKQIASALDYAHERGFIHRDVKSGNIIVAEHDHASLTDFGLVRAAEGTMLTSTGRVMGTPEYMSPEQAQGREIDYRTDLYSLGVVAYEALTARVPFRGETPTATHYMHVHEEPPRPTLMNPDLTKEMEAPILKALAKDPQQRYQSGKELSDALERPVKDHKLEEGPQQPNRTRRAWIAGAALALIVLALACAVFMWGKGLPVALPSTDTPTAAMQPVATWTNTPAMSPTTAAVPTAIPTSTPSATPQPTNTPTSATAIPTVSTSLPPPATETSSSTPTPPGALSYSYPAPVPGGRYPSSCHGGPTFSWTWSGVLRQDEYFDVRVWPSRHPWAPVDGQWMITCAPLDDFASHASVAWTKDNQFTYVPPDWVSDTLFCWSVAVVRGQNGTLLEQLSPESDLCVFKESWHGT